MADAELKEEACAVAVTLAEALVKTHPSEVAKAMQQVSGATGNKELAERARGVLK